MPDTDLSAGPELDAAVARACGLMPGADGWVCNYPNGGVPDWYRGEVKTSAPPYWKFEPSTDMNAAIFAAEKAGLFPDWVLWQKRVTQMTVPLTERVTWHVSPWDNINGGLGRWIVEAPTPSEAICRAILSLSKRKSA